MKIHLTCFLIMGSAYICTRSSLEHACWCMAFYQEHESRTCVVGQHSREPAWNPREEFFKIWSNFSAVHIIQSNLDAITVKNHFLILQVISSSEGLVITKFPRCLLQISSSDRVLSQVWWYTHTHPLNHSSYAWGMNKIIIFNQITPWLEYFDNNLVLKEENQIICWRVRHRILQVFVLIMHVFFLQLGRLLISLCMHDLQANFRQLLAECTILDYNLINTWLYG